MLAGLQQAYITELELRAALEAYRAQKLVGGATSLEILAPYRQPGFYGCTGEMQEYIVSRQPSS